jgi:hypothetical protein
MPIFQDPDRQCGYDESRPLGRDGKKDAEILSGRAGYEEPEDEGQEARYDIDAEAQSPVDNTEISNQTLETSDREELMQSIKRGESPTWVLNRTVS